MITMNLLRALAISAALLAVVLGVCYHRLRLRALLVTATVLGLCAYHFYMRLTVSNCWNAALHNHADFRRAWFRVTERERRLYGRLRVKQWKDKMPTYDPESFNMRTHTPEQIAQTTCQSELVHETNMVLSFLPLALARVTGLLPLLAISSAAGALGDCVFVVMQRFNRDRLVRMIDRRAARKTLTP